MFMCKFYFFLPADDQTVDSILVFDLVLPRGAQWVDWHSAFIPANSRQFVGH